MALINRFEDNSVEEGFIRAERGGRISALRALIVIAIGIYVAYILFNPLFFPGPSAAVFNLVAMATIAALAIAFVAVGQDFYLRWRWLDPLMFSILIASAVFLMKPLEWSEATTGTSFLDMAVVNLAIAFSFASVSFVANVRWFAAWALGLMAAYCLFLWMQPIDAFPRIHMLVNVAVFLSFALFVNWDFDRRGRAVFAAQRALEAEKAKTEELLYNVLPQEVASRLRAGEAIADSFSDVTVIFADIVGFSVLAKRLSPGHLVKLLNSFFLLADQCAEKHGIEKVKTIGDAYLAVSGGTASTAHGARDAINFARELIAEMNKLAEENGVDIKLRVGLHTGPVVGGVVGSSRLAYDYWGDTMNIASRIESAARPNGIAVSSATYHQCAGMIEFSTPEVLVLKGVGETEVRHIEV